MIAVARALCGVTEAVCCAGHVLGLLFVSVVTGDNVQREHIFRSASALDEDSRQDATSVDMTRYEAAAVECVNNDFCDVWLCDEDGCKEREVRRRLRRCFE